ncbi:hypothetical protein B0H14DRAFT_2652226 [Mycena olivaceomarginata]|nr:hypothetical protein B0H14DRAFT_2652226 [Mycena olivaceomarginata]
MGTAKLWSTIFIDTTLWSRCTASADTLLSLLESSLNRGKDYSLTMNVGVLQSTFVEEKERVRSMDMAWEWLRDSGLCVGSQLRHVTIQWLRTRSMLFEPETDFSDKGTGESFNSEPFLERRCQKKTGMLLWLGPESNRLPPRVIFSPISTKHAHIVDADRPLPSRYRGWNWLELLSGAATNPENEGKRFGDKKKEKKNKNDTDTDIHTRLGPGLNRRVPRNLCGGGYIHISRTRSIRNRVGTEVETGSNEWSEIGRTE